MEEDVFTRMCRCCLNSSEQLMVYAPSVREAFLELAGITVERSDGLPQWICSQCLALLRKAVRFRRRILHADTVLRDYLRRCAPFPIDERDPELSKYATQPLCQTQVLQFNMDKTKNGYHSVLQHKKSTSIVSDISIKIECDESIVKIEDQYSDIDDDLPLMELRINREDAVLEDDGVADTISEPVKRKKESKSRKRKKKKYENKSESDSDSEYQEETYNILILEPLESNDPLEPNEETPNLDETEISDVNFKKLKRRNQLMYLNTYKQFLRWKQEKNISAFTENVFLTYFNELELKNKPPTLVNIYSMLKATLLVKNGVNLGNYAKLKKFLKDRSKGYCVKPSKVFTKEDIDRFLKTAPDDLFLIVKVILIIGICGGCTTIELLNLTIHDIEEYDNLILIKIQEKKNRERSFMIPENFSQYVKKYIHLRPKNLEVDRFLVHYNHGIFAKTVMGRNKVSVVPRDVATFLKLQNPEKYIGFRKTFQALFDPKKCSANDFIDSECDSTSGNYENDSGITNNDTLAKKNDNMANSIDVKANHSDNTANSIDVKANHSDIANYIEIKANFSDNMDIKANYSDDMDVKANNSDEMANSNNIKAKHSDNMPNPIDIKANYIDNIGNPIDIKASYSDDKMANSNHSNNMANSINTKANHTDNIANSIDIKVNYIDEMAKDGKKKSNKTPTGKITKVPEKSWKSYIRVYELFAQWMEEKSVTNVTEELMLDYFKHLAKEFRPNSLFNMLSMLRNTILTKNGVDIKKFEILKQFLRSNTVGFERRTSKVFTESEIDMFLNSAPDYNYLAMKVVLVIGISGACTSHELTNLTTDNVKKHKNSITVSIKDGNNKLRRFIIPGQYYQYVKRYMDLRPKKLGHNKFFFPISNSSYTRQVIGKNRARLVPREVASFLVLPNPEAYNGYCFKKTSAALFGTKTCTIDSESESDNHSESDNDNYSENDKHNESDNYQTENNLMIQIQNIKKDTNNENKNEQIQIEYEPKIKLKKIKQDFDNHNESENIQNQNRNDLESDPLMIIQNIKQETVENTTVQDNCTYIQENCTKTQEICTKTQEICTKTQDFNTKTQEVCTKTQEINTKTEENEIDNFANITEKSKKKYLNAYKFFQTWMIENDFDSYSENVLLSYFKDISKKFQPNSLCAKYSMLRVIIKVRNGIDISNYMDLKNFINMNLRGYCSKKSRVFTMKEIDDFLREAPDFMYLHWKVVLIFGISGACHSKELLELTTENVKIRGKIITVKIISENNKRMFFIREKYVDIVKKYMNLRPDVVVDRFFLLFRKNVCVKQVMGINTIGGIPKQIAKYLNLPHPEEYTGQCYRRTSRSLFGGK